MVIYGEAIWSPVALLDKFLDGKPSSATRFGVRMGFVIRNIFDRTNAFSRFGSYLHRL